jgi:hypothetical protein
MAGFVHLPAASAEDEQTGGPVAAGSYDDSEAVQSEALRNGCAFGGTAEFVDYGPGLDGGGNNDDYIEINDLCPDGHGVKAWAWLDGIYLGGAYNGYGAFQIRVIWDPFKPYGNVVANDTIALKVCNVDGPNDSSGVGECGYLEWESVDG